jgi:hypothetical protein
MDSLKLTECCNIILALVPLWDEYLFILQAFFLALLSLLFVRRQHLPRILVVPVRILVMFAFRPAADVSAPRHPSHKTLPSPFIAL